MRQSADLQRAREALVTMARAIDLFSINEVAREYENTLERWIVDAANGNMTAGAIMRQMRELVIEKGEEAYLEGLREGGVDPPEMDDDDKTTVRDWTLGQISHITDFADAAAAVSKLKGDERTQARDMMLDRVAFWVDNLRMIGSLGTASAKENMPVRWIYGDTDHCPTCANLNGQRHKLKWFVSKGYIPQERGSETLDCHGYFCQCRLEADDGRTIMP